MNGRRTQRFIIIVLIAGLLTPAPVWADNGKKHFKQGQTLEAEKKFDRAAEAYLQALSVEPNNVEYRIAYQRAATQASVMLVRRGREAMEQGQYEDAYNTFRRAYQFDKTNALAKDLTSRALDLQRKAEGIEPVPITDTPYGASLPIIGPDPHPSSQRSPLPGAADDTVGPEKDKIRETIIFRNQELEDVVRELSKRVDLNVVFDSTFRSRKTNFEMRGVTVAQALDTLLMSNNLFFEPVNDNSVIVALDNTANRARLQQMSVQTFYLKSADEQMVQTIQTNISALFGQKVLVVPNAQLRSLTVRSTPETLKVVSNLIKALDKDKPEVLIDISIYEVSRNDLLEIGNQLLFDGFFGQSSSQSSIVPGTLNTLAVTAGQIISEQRLALAIPTSVIRLLQTRGNSKLIDSLQVHALDGQQVDARVGTRIPIQTASLPSSFASVQQQQPQNPAQNTQDRVLNSLSLGVPQIEYQDVGLNVTMTPTIYTDDDIKLEMEIETSGVQAGPTSLTPVFTQRRLKSVATVQTGQAAMMAAVAQNRREESRTSLPIIGFLPVVGRFFSIPSNRTNTTDLIITVTPHIIRSADIREEDRLAMSSGMQLQGVSESVESFLEKREIARRQRERASAQAEVAQRPATDQKPQPPTTDQKSQPPTDRQVASADQPSAPGVQLPASINQQGARPPVVTSDMQTVSTTTATMALNPGSVPGGAFMPGGARTEPNPLGAGTVMVQLQPNISQPQVGQVVTVTVIARSDQPIQRGHFVLRFDSSVLRVQNVAEGSTLATASRNAQVSIDQDQDGMVIVTVEMPENISMKLGTAPLVQINFEVLSQGNTVLMVAPDATTFTTPDGEELRPVSQPVGIFVK